MDKTTATFRAGEQAITANITWDVTQEQLTAIATRKIVIDLGTKARTKKGLPNVVDVKASEHVPGVSLNGALSKMAQLTELKTQFAAGSLTAEEFNVAAMELLS